MTFKEFGQFADAIKTYFPRENTLPTKDAAQLWYEELKDLDYQATVMGLRKYVALNKFAPTIADIREQYANIVCGKPVNGSQAWSLVLNTLKLVEREGCASKKFAALPEYMQKAVGGRAQFLEWADNPQFNKEVAKSNFLKCYTVETERYMENARLHPEVYKITTQQNKVLEIKQ